MTRLRLKAESQVWIEVPSIEILTPLQRDRWKQKLATRQIVQQGGFSNILMTMIHTEELEQANISFLANILQAKHMMIQD